MLLLNLVLQLPESLEGSLVFGQNLLEGLLCKHKPYSVRAQKLHFLKSWKWSSPPVLAFGLNMVFSGVMPSRESTPQSFAASFQASSLRSAVKAQTDRDILGANPSPKQQIGSPSGPDPLHFGGEGPKGGCNVLGPDVF